ncbi:MAG: glycosyltransferase [Pseudomonadota bacterium]|nr:glycosyltransferase [Pseudomonadota bacterium]
MSSTMRLFLAAPNVSAQKGGEAIKALQIFEELQAVLGDVIQITHIRNQAELSKHPLSPQIEYLPDDWVDRLMFKSVVFRPFLTLWFSYRAVKRAEVLAKLSGGTQIVIHQTEPNSPVHPRWTSRKFPNVFGPINGNIYYPKAFRQFESASAKLRRLFHFPLQYVNRMFSRGIANADLVLVAGGERTIDSLSAAGVSRAKIFETSDCGIPDAICRSDKPSVATKGRFIHFGRLVFHKGTALAIEAVAKAGSGVTLDIIGRGPELDRCKALVKSLEIEERVRFLDWYENREDLVASFENYCGMILPSIEDANGIVVQESMAAGLVPICLNWGGPQLLVEDSVSGFLVSPEPLVEIVPALAKCLKRLAEEPNLAAEMSANALQRAKQWSWSLLAKQWTAKYMSLVT